MDLGLRCCPRCDYDLRGLPPRHRCPECDYAYDKSMLVLEGWSIPTLSGDSVDVGGWGILVALVILPLLGARVVLRWNWPATAALVLVVVALGIGLFLLLRVRSRSPRAAVRYLVTDDGVGRLGGRIHAWKRYSHVTLTSAGYNSWRLHVYPSFWIAAPMINATLHCPGDEAEAVRTEIERRMSDAWRREHDGV